MSYKKIGWINDVTPLNAENMNHMDDGIADVQTTAEKAMSAAENASSDIETLPGKKTVNGEIFNDYENNKAISPFSHAEGRETIAGQMVYLIVAVSKSTSSYTIDAKLDDVKLTVGDTYSIKFSNSYINYGTISSIKASTTNSNQTIVTVSPSGQNVFPFEDGVSAGAFFVLSKPDAGTIAFDDGAHAEGYSSQASLRGAHAEGYLTKAIDRCAHAEGRGTEAKYAAHAEGKDTKAYGDWSHAGGLASKAKGQGAFTHGYLTTTTKDYETSFGLSNRSKDDTVFSVGNGDVGSNYSVNGIELAKDGDFLIQRDTFGRLGKSQNNPYVSARDNNDADRIRLLYKTVSGNDHFIINDYSKCQPLDRHWTVNNVSTFPYPNGQRYCGLGYNDYMKSVADYKLCREFMFSYNHESRYVVGKPYDNVGTDQDWLLYENGFLQVSAGENKGEKFRQIASVSLINEGGCLLKTPDFRRDPDGKQLRFTMNFTYRFETGNGCCLIGLNQIAPGYFVEYFNRISREQIVIALTRNSIGFGAGENISDKDLYTYSEFPTKLTTAIPSDVQNVNVNVNLTATQCIVSISTWHTSDAKYGTYTFDSSAYSMPGYVSIGIGGGGRGNIASITTCSVDHLSTDKLDIRDAFIKIITSNKNAISCDVTVNDKASINIAASPVLGANDDVYGFINMLNQTPFTTIKNSVCFYGNSSDVTVDEVVLHDDTFSQPWCPDTSTLHDLVVQFSEQNGNNQVLIYGKDYRIV